MWHIVFVLVAICVLSAPRAYADEDVTIPYGAGILPNGFVGEEEWADAARVELGNDVVLYMSQDSQYIYIGIRSTDTTHTGIDLYFQTDRSCQYRLHISSAHGQSEKCDTAWTVMDYCENRRWASNIVESIFVEGKTEYIAPEVFEYQVEKSLVPGSDLRLMIHLKRPEKIVPRGATVDWTGEWFTIRI